jgi:osmotically-inducible protein OsmY
MIRECRKDDDVRADVVDHLEWDERVDASNVKVGVSNGVVALTGSVSSRRSSQAAECDALELQGVKSVDNRLKVRPPEGLALPTDSMISDDIHYLVRLYPEINLADLHMRVRSGVARLKGSVDSYWKKAWIEELASQVTGVLAVRNELAVVPSDDMLDKTIAEHITAALSRNISVESSDINVNVEKGEVHVFGTVRNQAAREAVLNACRYTRGVRRIESHLTIG